MITLALIRESLNYNHEKHKKHEIYEKYKVIKNPFVCFVYFVFKKLLGGQNACFLAQVPTFRMSRKESSSFSAGNWLDSPEILKHRRGAPQSPTFLASHVIIAYREAPITHY